MYYVLMRLQINCRKIVGGSGKGKALVTNEAINFLTMVDTKRSIIVDQNHELFGKSIKNIVLVFPNASGSTVGAYAIYSLKVNGVAPIAVVCSNKADIITASGCAISNIPVVDMLERPVSHFLKSGMEISINADKGIAII